MTQIIINVGVFSCVIAALTYVFRVRPWLDDMAVAREMRYGSTTNPA